MRLEQDVQDFAARIKLECEPEHYFDLVEVYRACVPSDFWYVSDKDVTHNRAVWARYVNAYLDRLKVARQRGYGLLFEGDNGVGKTMFMSYILVQAVKAGYTAYYTTVLDLDFNLKRGMGSPEVMDRMDEMLGADFVGIDELSKEQFKSGDSWMRTQVERVLKRRHDNNRPTILATNAPIEKLGEAYGATVRSVLAGKYQHVVFDAGDARERLRDRMLEEMDYGDRRDA